VLVKLLVSASLFSGGFDHMTTIRVPLAFRSIVAALAIAGLQFSSAILPSAYAQAQDAKPQPNFFDWENLQTDVPGVADRTDTHLVNPWGLTINTKANIFWISDITQMSRRSTSATVRRFPW
jgi:hypothetical protein